MAEGFTENTTIDEGFNSQGVRTQIHLEGQEIIVQKTYDAAPHLDHAKHARDSTDGQNWGRGRFVCHIPPVHYAKICVIKDRTEREKAVRQFMRDNPQFVMFHKALK